MARSHSIGWGIRREGGSLWTRNAVRGVSVAGERRKRDGRNEWRRWDARRSKVAATLLRCTSNPSELIPSTGANCVYLGASSGTTVSHLHDHVCGGGNHHGGQIVAIDISPRMMRDFISLSEKRPGIVPILGNARTPHSIIPYLRSRAQWLFQDLSMTDQATAFIEATRVLLESQGMGMIAIKAASERWTEGGDEALFSDAESKIRHSEHLELIERIDLSGLEEQHSVIVVRRL